MSRLGVIANPDAGLGNGRTPAATLLAALERAGHEGVDLSGECADSSERLARAAAPDLDALLVAGGDGTVHTGVNVVAGTPLPLGVIAVGSGNDFARAMRLPQHDARAGLDLVLANLGREPRVIDTLLTRGAARARHTVCVLSAGFDAAVNARANSYRFPPGGGKYIRGVLAELRGFTPYGYRIVVDGEQRELQGTLVAVANTPFMGGGMKVAPEADPTDGLADVLVADGLTPWQIIRVFPRLYSGSHLSHPAVSMVRGSSIRIEPLAGRRRPPVVHGDGEQIDDLPLEISVERGALRLLAPPVR